MNIEEIKELIKLLEESKLSCLEITEGTTKIRMEKNLANGAFLNAPALTAIPNEMQPAVPCGTTATSADASEGNRSAEKMPEGLPVKSPMVGVFYAAPSPDDSPYVAVGDSVKKGDVICIVEAMKLLNEITSEYDGVISEICVKNGEVVEFGQPLFYVR